MKAKALIIAALLAGGVLLSAGECKGPQDRPKPAHDTCQSHQKGGGSRETPRDC